MTKKNKSKDAVKDAESAQNPQQIDPAILEQIGAIRTRIHELFGKVALAMMALPRYRHQTLLDLNHILLEPLMRDRVALAAAKKEGETNADNLTGIAIWANVSVEVDAKIREQIKAGVFPVRLKSDEWTSGDINWLLDVVAPNQKLAASVIANFKQIVKQGDVRIHPLITRLVDPEILKKMGAAPISEPEEKQADEMV